MTADFIQPYIFYVPWATPKPKLSPEMEAQLKRIHKLLKEKDELGGQLPHDKMAVLRQNLAPFFYPRLRRMYDQTLSENRTVRNPALKAFSVIFEPWLAGFEGLGIEIRNYQPEESQALLNRTIPANLTDVPAETKAPQLRQRDPSVLYQTHQRLDPDSLNALNAELNRDFPDNGDVGAPPDEGGWSETLKKKYASMIGHPKLKGLRDEISKAEKELNDRSIDDTIVQGYLNKELAILHRRFDAAGRQFMMGRGFAGTDVDTDNVPGVFYLATKPPSPMAIHPERVDTLSLGPDLDTGINRNREQNWQQFILGYPKQISRYDTGALNFQSMAERRGIQRAAIEIALNLLASNYEQRRPDDRFRRVVLPSPWQPPPPEVPISMELEPTKRPVELDTQYYMDLIYQYNRWKDDDWYDAREKIVTMFPGQVAPPANYNGPFTIPTMFEYQDVAAKYLGNLVPTWNSIVHTANIYPRPFLTAVLQRIQRGINFGPGSAPQIYDSLYEEANGMELKLLPQELAVLRELTEPSWNFHWLPYPPVENRDEDVPRQLLDEFERDIEALPEAAKPPYWSSGKPPIVPERHQYFNIPESQRDLRSFASPQISKKIAPDIFETYNLNPYTLSDPAIPFKTRTQYAALMIQSQVIEELNNNWESRFPVNEKVWGFARDRLINPVRTVVAGRTFTEYHHPRQYFSMRRWPPCEQGLASQEVIRNSGPVIQTKVIKARKSVGEKNLDSLKKPQEAQHIAGGLPNFPFGETPYQQAYLSYRVQEDLKDGIFKLLPTAPRPPVDYHALPPIPPSFRPRSIPFEALRQRAITKAQAIPGLPSLTEYYREENEAKLVRDYKQWVRENEKIKAIEELAGGKNWQKMNRDEKEKWADLLVFEEMEEQRNLQNFGGMITRRGDKNTALEAGDRNVLPSAGRGTRKRSRSGIFGGERRGGKLKRRGNRPAPIQIEPVMSGAL
ncbi:hypothetical protein DID88_007042 [Monilinia fructigena]|uniref:Uncharacterized protein n=1 Tax=Monilinia fructigena TaxID=38457 RepID=A0A395J740_9HELO|nr:hypothetical protein DID88_007042 [Monilinia fructigena]